MKTFSYQGWEKLGELVAIRSPWVTVFLERLRDSRGDVLDYWRVERPDSVVVIPIYKDSILLPHPTYRPGVQAKTWDFPGGRVEPGVSPRDAGVAVLIRELNIQEEVIVEITAINNVAWHVDSSFSSQKLWGMTARLSEHAKLVDAQVGRKVSLTVSDLETLREDLTCLQCRMVLREWLACA